MLTDNVAAKIASNPEEYFPRLIMLEEKMKYEDEQLKEVQYKLKNPEEDKFLKQ